MEATNNITLPLHGLGEEPQLRVTGETKQDGLLVLYVETPKPLFFTSQCFAYHWDCTFRQMFTGEERQDCMHRAREWANYLLTYEEDRCYSATGPMISH